jgi:hypothetical protein
MYDLIELVPEDTYYGDIDMNILTTLILKCKVHGDLEYFDIENFSFGDIMKLADHHLNTMHWR